MGKVDIRTEFSRFAGLSGGKRTLHEQFLKFRRQFPKEEMYSLTDQVRTLIPIAIGANIAEAWAKRRYEKHFISKLNGCRRRATGNTALA